MDQIGLPMIRLEIPLLPLMLFLLQTSNTDIVVTGKRLAEVHEICVKSGCTPLRDAQASIAMAEALFRDGNYGEAKSLLAAALNRNKKYASVAPKPVAALYEAYATVSLHEGDQDRFQYGVMGQVRTLRNHVPAGDPVRISAELALGDMWLQLHRYDQAAITYRGIVRQAAATNQPVTELLGSMRLVWLTALMGEPTKANRMLAELEQKFSGQQAAYSYSFDVLRLKLAVLNKNDIEVGTIISRFAEAPSATPLLLFAPPYDLSSESPKAAAAALRFKDVTPTIGTASDVEMLSWIDVGFYIRPNGTTSDIEVLRSSRVLPRWAPIILRQVARRRYSVASITAGAGIYRVERVTKASSYETPTDSLVRRRAAESGFHVLDLTTGSVTPS